MDVNIRPMLQKKDGTRLRYINPPPGTLEEVCLAAVGRCLTLVTSPQDKQRPPDSFVYGNSLTPGHVVVAVDFHDRRESEAALRENARTGAHFKSGDRLAFHR